MLWTAVGQYYTANAQQYSIITKKPLQTSISYFANVFAALFNLILAGIKLLSGLIVSSSADASGPTRPMCSCVLMMGVLLVYILC